MEGLLWVNIAWVGIDVIPLDQYGDGGRVNA